jgi:hypothetical protein
MRTLLLLISLCLTMIFVGQQVGADSVVDSGTVQIDRTEISSIDSFERKLDNGDLVVYDRKLTVHGKGFLATATWPKVKVDGVDAWGVENPDSNTITIYLPSTATGSLDLEISVPQDSAKATVEI